MVKLALLFPGQGAQYIGMGKDFYDRFSVCRQIFEEADAILGRDFSALIFAGSKEELTETRNSQPAIYVVSYAIYKVLRSLYPNLEPYAVAGLSLGEYTALAVSGKISFSEGLKLVSQRAALMQEACVISPGSMQVVLGAEESFIVQILSSLPDNKTCVANINCPGQVVIAGPKQDLDEAVLALKQAGVKRLLPLDVSGAFHSVCMQSAREGLAPFLSQVPLQETKIHLVMNTPGDFVGDLSVIRENLILQVTQPVRWQQGIENMERQGVSHFLELGCGKTLQGMNKRIGVKAPTYSIEKVEDLDNLPNVEEFKNVIA